MGPSERSTRPWTRRRLAALAALALSLSLGPVGGHVGVPGSAPGVARAVGQEASILVISQRRLLNDTDHSQALLKAEIELTAALQARVDAVKEELTAEEQELAGLRASLDRVAFEVRVAAFDHKVRRQRRDAQEKAAALQNAFRSERLKLVDALGPLLEQLRQAHGASVILNADQLLTSDPALDVTDEAIALFNASVPTPAIPDLEALLAAPADASGETPPAQ